MDPRLERAGSIEELNALIDENPYILEKIDAVPFVNTPLHVAAASGNIKIAMEILNLMPSFARKLNTSGASPLHLAIDMNRARLVCRMLWRDPSLARIKGRNGITPFLSLVIRGKSRLVAECLRASPECIQDVSVDDHNALHIAVMNDRFEVLKVLTAWIQRMCERNAHSIENRVLNQLDSNYNSPLHLAACKNDQLAVSLLLDCRWVHRNEVNRYGLTYLDILRNHVQRDAGEEPVVGVDLDLVPRSRARYEILKSPFTFWTFCSTLIKRIRTNTSDEARGVFLIVCTLIITSTYQTALQLPGGVHPSEASNAGSVVMKQTFFILVWVSNTIGFCSALFYTFCLIPPGTMFATWFIRIGTALFISYALAMAVISPHPLVFLSLTIAFFLFFALCLLLEAFVLYLRKHDCGPEPRLSWF